MGPNGVPSLFVIQGRDQGTRFELRENPTSLGRDSDNSFQLHDTEVSRKHAEITLDGSRVLLRDLNSSNGTYVNGKAVRQALLRSGDQLQLGRSLLLFTGPKEESIDSGDSRIDIVSSVLDGDESRILHSISHAEGSELLATPADQTQSPWLARARSNLQIMYRTSLAVSHTLDIDQLLSRIMDMIFEWVEADRGCIMLKDQKTGKLEPRVRRHRRGIQTEERISISQTILDYVVENGEGVLTSNARDDNRWDPAQSIVKMGVREAICVPMQGRYDVVGVIYIDTSLTPQRIAQQKSTNQFGQEHLKLMVAIAHQAALAIEDTSYYQAMVQAERLAAIGQTIATLSHHIKNILQGVRGGSYLIELGMTDHEKATHEGEDGVEIDAEAAINAVATMRKGWKIVDKNQERISGLVMDMLTFSKERVPEPVPSDLNEVTADVVELVQSRAKDVSVELQWRPAADIPVIEFDPDAIHRAVLNVVTNAIDACEGRDPAVVTVSTELDAAAKRAVILVEDTGVGIAPEDVESVFTVFVSKKGSRGTGLGLSVTQKIFNEHGGAVSLTSEPGKGTIFRLELPLESKIQKSDAAEDEEMSGPDDEAARQQADDDDDDPQTLVNILDDSSHG
ncbi:Sensor protein ZraS [Posidoniimonas corsicana]|uniref:histidine kinase n=1 Tax=Posidoniimonas corsicana TaxID=1938618 RepID=A0A5C5VE15_9BACT|nr:Sensor protein ZraS [Posidoniimonas corsicana]